MYKKTELILKEIVSSERSKVLVVPVTGHISWDGTKTTLHS